MRSMLVCLVLIVVFVAPACAAGDEILLKFRTPTMRLDSCGGDSVDVTRAGEVQSVEVQVTDPSGNWTPLWTEQLPLTTPPDSLIVAPLYTAARGGLHRFRFRFVDFSGAGCWSVPLDWVPTGVGTLAAGRWENPD